jgi:hypothetical protein
MDGVSVSIFYRRLISALRDNVISVPALTALDYNVWMQDRLASAEFSPHRAYWDRQASQSAGPLKNIGQLNGSRSSIGDRYTVVLSKDFSTKVLGFSKEFGHGLFSTLICVYALALYGCFRQPSFDIGTPFSGRIRPGTEDVLGMFVNLFAIPFRLNEQASVTDVMASFRNWLLESFEFQDYLVDTKTHRSVEDFNILFALQNMVIDPVEITSDLSVSPIPFYNLPWRVAKFDLSLYAMEVDDQIVLSFEFRSACVSKSQVIKLGDMVKSMLSKLIEEPNTIVCNCLDEHMKNYSS